MTTTWPAGGAAVRPPGEGTAARRLRLAAALLTAVMLAVSMAITACDPSTSYPVQAAYTPPGPYAAVIASPATEKAFYQSTTVPAALGIIRYSDGRRADHTSIENTAYGGNPGGELGYATAWLEYQLLGNATAAGAFSGSHPELLSNTNWPGSAVK